MRDSVRVAAVQMNCRLGDKPANLAQAEALLSEASGQDADRRGEIRGRYRKSHLYPPERALFKPGDELPVFELDGLHVGMAICFEAAFPPISSTLALGGAQVIFNPSAVPIGYGYLQDLRTRARAQDNQVFVVAVNHVGREGIATYCGRSQIADPRGDVLVLAPQDRPAAITAELDLGVISEQCLQEPVFEGFRPELYHFDDS
jgi:predicted amidohydrolase